MSELLHAVRGQTTWFDEIMCTARNHCNKLDHHVDALFFNNIIALKKCDSENLSETWTNGRKLGDVRVNTMCDCITRSFLTGEIPVL